MIESDADLDCLRCGACCRTGHDGRLLVPAEDLVRWQRLGRLDPAAAIQPGHFGEAPFATGAAGTTRRPPPSGALTRSIRFRPG